MGLAPFRAVQNHLSGAPWRGVDGVPPVGTLSARVDRRDLTMLL